jgi:hypothetical protein
MSTSVSSSIVEDLVAIILTLALEGPFLLTDYFYKEAYNYLVPDLSQQLPEEPTSN